MTAPVPPTTGSVSSSVVSGVRWGAFNQVVQQAVRFGVQILLTRLLVPEDFGLVALAFVVVNLGALLTGLGFAQALLQVRVLTKHLVDAAFVGSALISAQLALLVAAGAGPLSALLGDPDLEPVLRVLALIFLFQGIEGVPNALLRRRLMFRAFILSSTWGTVLGGLTGVLLGLAGAGVWALVGFALIEAVVATSLGWLFAIRAGVWRPGLTGDLRPLRTLLGYTGAVTASRLLYFGARNADNLIVGRVLGTTSLGYYGLAYRVMLYPIQRGSEVLSHVALPAFALMQDEPERLCKAYLRSVRALAAMVVPVTVGVAVTAHHLVPVVFGPVWEPAVVPLRILALSGPAVALMRLNGTLWEATGRAGLSLWMSVIALVVLVPGFLVGVRWGTTGVAVAYTATTYVALLPALLAVSRTSDARLRLQLTNVLPILVAAVALVAVALGTDRLPLEGNVLPLLSMVAAGALAYVAALWVTDRGVLTEVRSMLRVGAS